jgi:hypothetical protein
LRACTRGVLQKERGRNPGRLFQTNDNPQISGESALQIALVSENTSGNQVAYRPALVAVFQNTASNEVTLAVPAATQQSHQQDGANASWADPSESGKKRFQFSSLGVSNMRARLLLWTSLVGLVACGPPAPKEKPQISLDRTKLGFNQEFNSGTFIGTTTFNTVVITNEGVEDLVLSNVSISGSEFTKTGPDLTTIPFHKTAVVEVAFTPTAPQLYSGSLTIDSNAENEPSAVVDLSGCGVDPNKVDLSYCKKSTDF